jgi:hypothetical protein
MWKHCGLKNLKYRKPPKNRGGAIGSTIFKNGIKNWTPTPPPKKNENSV